MHMPDTFIRVLLSSAKKKADLAQGATGASYYDLLISKQTETIEALAHIHAEFSVIEVPFPAPSPRTARLVLQPSSIQPIRALTFITTSRLHLSR